MERKNVGGCSYFFGQDLEEKIQGHREILGPLITCPEGSGPFLKSILKFIHPLYFLEVRTWHLHLNIKKIVSWVQIKIWRSICQDLEGEVVKNKTVKQVDPWCSIVVSRLGKNVVVKIWSRKKVENKIIEKICEVWRWICHHIKIKSSKNKLTLRLTSRRENKKLSAFKIN